MRRGVNPSHGARPLTLRYSKGRAGGGPALPNRRTRPTPPQPPSKGSVSTPGECVFGMHRAPESIPGGGAVSGPLSRRRERVRVRVILPPLPRAPESISSGRAAHPERRRRVERGGEAPHYQTVAPVQHPPPLIGNDISAVLLRNTADISIKQGGWAGTN